MIQGLDRLQAAQKLVLQGAQVPRWVDHPLAPDVQHAGDYVVQGLASRRPLFDVEPPFGGGGGGGGVRRVTVLGSFRSQSVYTIG